MKNWREMTPAEVLDSYLALTPTQAAYCIGRMKRNGEPNRVAVVELVRDGSLPLIDPSQPNTRWTISAANVRAYLEGKRPALRRVAS